MQGKIFVNYRRDDVPGDARGVRDGLAAKFGKANVFMDVDNLIVGQRFDLELAKALDACDMLIAVIGPRWMDLLKDRTASGERDYVREEIAAALARKITVIPVRVGREGSMPVLPRRDELPEDIRDLVLHHKLDVAHERFGRDMAELTEGIVAVRKVLPMGKGRGRPTAIPWSWVGAGTMALLAIGYVSAARLGVPIPWPAGPATRAIDDASRAAEAERVKAAAERLSEAETKLAVEQKARVHAEARAKQLADAADRARRDQEARATAEAESKRKAKEIAERDPAVEIAPGSSRIFVSDATEFRNFLELNIRDNPCDRKLSSTVKRSDALFELVTDKSFETIWGADCGYKRRISVRYRLARGSEVSKEGIAVQSICLAGADNVENALMRQASEQIVSEICNSLT